MMSWSILLLLTALCFVSSEMKTISSQFGSDLHLLVPELCNSSQDLFFDVYSEGKHIGSHHVFLEGINGYHGRLYFNQENCTIMLKNLSETDGLSYKIRILRVENHVSVIQDLDFKISIIAPEQTSPENETQEDSPSRINLYVSAVSSLVPFVLAFIVGIFWFLTMYDHVRNQLQAITRGLQIFWIFTIICQVVSLCCWSCHGCLGQLLTAIPITGILIGDVIFCVWRAHKHGGLCSHSVAINAPVPTAYHEEGSPEESGGSAQVPVCECWPRCGESSTFHHAALSPAGDSDIEAAGFWSKCKKYAKKFWLWVLLCMQLLFTLLVWISYSTMDSGTSGDIFHSLNSFILPIFASSFFVIVCLPFICFCLCCTRNTTRRNNGSPTDRSLHPSVTKPFLDTIKNHEL